MKMRIQTDKSFSLTKIALYSVLAFTAALNTACSTPPVPNSDPDQPDTAWWAYQDCLESLPRTTNRSVCDNVGTTRGMSPSSYTYGSTGGNVGPYPVSATYGYGAGPTYYSTRSFKSAGTTTAVTSVQSFYDQAYREYLKTLDAGTLRELTERWKHASSVTR